MSDPALKLKLLRINYDYLEKLLNRVEQEDETLDLRQRLARWFNEDYYFWEYNVKFCLFPDIVLRPVAIVEDLDQEEQSLPPQGLEAEKLFDLWQQMETLSDTLRGAVNQHNIVLPITSNRHHAIVVAYSLTCDYWGKPQYHPWIKYATNWIGEHYFHEKDLSTHELVEYCKSRYGGEIS